MRIDRILTFKHYTLYQKLDKEEEEGGKEEDMTHNEKNESI